MGKTKPLVYWAIKADGRVFPNSIHYQLSGAVALWCKRFQETWPELQKLGYSVVKVTVCEEDT